MQQPGTPGQVHPCIVTTTIPHHPTFLLFPTPLGGISFPTDTASKSCKIWWAMLRLHGFVQPYTPHPEKKGLVWGKLSHLWRSKVWVCTVLGTWFFHDIPQILILDERQKRGCPAIPSGVDVPENGRTDVKGSFPASVASKVLLSPCGSQNLQILVSLWGLFTLPFRCYPSPLPPTHVSTFSREQLDCSSLWFLESFQTSPLFFAIMKFLWLKYPSYSLSLPIT